MLEVIYGQTTKNAIARQLVELLQPLLDRGTLYIGYPVLASADESISIDVLLVSEQHGLVVFLLGSGDGVPQTAGEWTRLQEQQDRVYFAITNHLGRHERLRRGRALAVVANVVTLLPGAVNRPEGNQAVVAGPGTLATTLEHCVPTPPEFHRALNAALQRVTTIKPAKRRDAIARAGSRGDLLRTIEKEIANLDQWQKQAAIETPDGPQRIRGLAGSGKTVVLALKAAYLHAQHPEWNIAVTFYSRSLYQQITDLIRRFSFEHLGDEPDWDKLRVLHAWGGMARKGVYMEMAERAGAPVRDFAYGKATFGMSGAFTGVCAELLAATSATRIDPFYDAVLIDEAQDLPPAFFQAVYRFTKPPKRISWAYDELQNLTVAAMPSVAEMFGLDANSRPMVSLSNSHGQPRQDLILPICYRNTPWGLTLAHALGLGIYRNGGLVQHFDEPSLWGEVGYELVDGELSFGSPVRLRRRPDSYPAYLTDLLRREDAVVTAVFPDETTQAAWVAAEIKKNLQEDEIERDDILIILPDAYTAKSRSAVVMQALAQQGISSHLAGVTTSTDDMFDRSSVAISSIYRAKGNEAPMVYVLNSEYCHAGYELIRMRNILFTAITRSRAWLRICGCGTGMVSLKAEIDRVVQNNYELAFTVPTLDQLKHMRMIHRDRSADERARMRKAEQAGSDFIEAIERGEISPENLPSGLRSRLKSLFQDDEE